MTELRLAERRLRASSRSLSGHRSQVSSLPSGQGHAQVIGVTGPPGSGKSTLVNALGTAVRAAGQTMAVLAIDPSSHLTGGAVLGDRVRMSSHSSDDNVFIRSMGTRGSGTGLATAARDAVRVLDAAGYDVVVVETVGVGQVELDVLMVADTVAVVMVPGLGDSMQMNKAGIMEIGDLYVVNMADRPETDRFVKDLKTGAGAGRTSRRPAADLPDDGCLGGGCVRTLGWRWSRSIGPTERADEGNDSTKVNCGASSIKNYVIAY